MNDRKKKESFFTSAPVSDLSIPFVPFHSTLERSSTGIVCAKSNLNDVSKLVAHLNFF